MMNELYNTLSKPQMKVRFAKTNSTYVSLQSESVVYQRPKYSAEAEIFHYLALGFDCRKIILNIRPSVFFKRPEA